MFYTSNFVLRLFVENYDYGYLIDIVKHPESISILNYQNHTNSHYKSVKGKIRFAFPLQL